MVSEEYSSQIIRELIETVGKDHVLNDEASIEDYKRDMADYEASPMAVVKPSSEEEITKIVALADRHRVPIVARGAGSSLTGAAVLQDSIVLDMRAFNRILRVDPVNYYVQVQAGVSLDDLNKELKEYGFFFPPDPASSFICTVGGAIAEGSGGMRCVKYGTIKDWVLALRVVLASGIVVRLGEPLAKNRAGYDLVHLFIGSEGTLGIISEAYLKILPIPTETIRRMLVQFDAWSSAGRAIQELRKSKILPNLIEFMDKGTVSAVNQALNLNFEEAEATLLIDLEETRIVFATQILQSNGARQITIAKDEEEAERLYQARAWSYVAVKDLGQGLQVEDVVVPIDRLVEYLNFVKEIASKFNLNIPVVGHAGDGNVHPMILYDRADPRSRESANAAFEEICRYAIRVGGTITGEHGVGIQKINFFREQLIAHEGTEALRLMKEIKQVFDPNGIMNPGKYVDAA